MKKMINKLKKSKVLKNSIWLTILQVVNTVIPVLTIPYITRVLGTNEYGVFSIALNWILYFQVAVEFGFGLSGARKVALLDKDDTKELNKIYNNIISSRMILLIICFVLLNIIALITRRTIKIYISMLILFIMIIGTAFQLTFLFQGKQDMKFITIINVIARTVSVILIFLLVKSSSHLYLYCLLYSITLLLSSIISNAIAYKKYGLKFRFSKIKEIKKEINDGKYLFASTAMTKVFSGFGTTILGILSTATITGIYSAIYKIPYILTMFFSPISQALYPYNSAKFEKGYNEGIKSVKKVCVPVLIGFTFISIIIVLFRNIAVNILFGEEYAPYSIIVIPLVIQFIFAMINNFLGIQVLVASGNTKKYTQAFTIGCIAILLLNSVLGKFFDIYGIAIAAALGEFVLTISLLCKIKSMKVIKND